MSLNIFNVPHCSFPTNCSRLLARVRHDWWTYCQLHALQDNWTLHQLFHIPYYCPIVSLATENYTNPVQVGSEYLFEWRYRDSVEPIVAIHFLIHPGLTFLSPQTTITTVHHHPHPLINIYWSNLPISIDQTALNFLQELHALHPEEGLEYFISYLDNFIIAYYAPVTPFTPPQHQFHPTQPPTSYDHYSSELAE
jgi:hypothetical protein